MTTNLTSREKDAEPRRVLVVLGSKLALKGAALGGNEGAASGSCGIRRLRLQSNASLQVATKSTSEWGFPVRKYLDPHWK